LRDMSSRGAATGPARRRSAPAPTIDSPYKYSSLEGGIELRFDGKQPANEVLAEGAPEAERTVLRTRKPTQATLQMPETDGWVNRLVDSDNLLYLRLLQSDPQVRGRVKLVYIDPPFATGFLFVDRQDQAHYSDELVGARYLEFLRKRLILLRELLSPDGLIFVHLDDKMVHYAKVLMDEVFGTACFRNMITRQKCHSKNSTAREFGSVADYLLAYSKTLKWTWNRVWEPWTEDRVRSAEFHYRDPGSSRRYKPVPIHAPGVRHGATGGTWRGREPPPGKHWMYTPSKLDALDSRGEIYWSKNGTPRRKVYLDTRPGAPVTDIWLGLKDPMNQHTSETGYPTEKNQLLVERVILAASNPGDLVLDCFAGSGTTCAAAEKLGRRWIGVDSNPRAIDLSERRLTQSVDGTPLRLAFDVERIRSTARTPTNPPLVD
jgi:adenine-specific DNA-methyltransferase